MKTTVTRCCSTFLMIESSFLMFYVSIRLLSTTIQLRTTYQQQYRSLRTILTSRSHHCILVHESSSSHRTATTICIMDQVNDVDIDRSGRFKYILLKIIDKSTSNKSKYIVRGYERCGYHADIFAEVEQQLASKYKLDCVGGGRIEHDADKRTIKGFGKADHAISVDILKKQYPHYNSISWSNDGY